MRCKAVGETAEVQEEERVQGEGKLRAGGGVESPPEAGVRSLPRGWSSQTGGARKGFTPLTAAASLPPPMWPHLAGSAAV